MNTTTDDQRQKIRFPTSPVALAPLPLVGAIAGKLVADLCFFLPTIISYELLQRCRSSGKEEAL